MIPVGNFHPPSADFGCNSLSSITEIWFKQGIVNSVASVWREREAWRGRVWLGWSREKQAVCSPTKCKFLCFYRGTYFVVNRSHLLAIGSLCYVHHETVCCAGAFALARLQKHLLLIMYSSCLQKQFFFHHRQTENVFNYLYTVLFSNGTNHTMVPLEKQTQGFA